MEIIEYKEKYLEDVKDLLVELQRNNIALDKDKLEVLHPEFRDRMALLELEDIRNNNGKCYLAVENKKAVGLIMGYIMSYDMYDYLDYKCPIRGKITDLIVSKSIRNNGIGNKLVKTMENYFKESGCEYIMVDVFGYNEPANKYYEKLGYRTRIMKKIKKIEDDD